MDIYTVTISAILIFMFLGGMTIGIGVMKLDKQIVLAGIIFAVTSVIIVITLLQHLNLQPAPNAEIRYIYPQQMEERANENFHETREI